MMTQLFQFLRRFFFPILIIAALLALGGIFLLGRYSVYQAHPELKTAEKADAILAKVATLIELPKGEQPQMATIEDAKSVKQAQPFLKDAENGDILIVYTHAQTALLYRPTTNKLIAVGPVTNDTTVPQPKVSEPEPQQATSTPHATSTKK